MVLELASAIFATMACGRMPNAAIGIAPTTESTKPWAIAGMKPSTAEPRAPANANAQVKITKATSSSLFLPTLLAKILTGR